MGNTLRRLSFLALALATASCKHGGGYEPPANFAGEWELTATNFSAATFVHCTGDMVGLEGVRLDSLPSETTTCYSDVAPVTQSGSVVTLMPVDYFCDNGDSGSFYGGGTVDGKHIDFKMSTSSDSHGSVSTDKYTGTKTSATTFVLYEWQVSNTGATTGSCDFSPRIRYDGVIVDPFLAGPERRKVPSISIPGRLVPKLIESLGKR